MKAVVVYSGGMDSYTLLNDLIQNEGMELYTLTFDYGQRHKKEIDYAVAYCKEMDIPYEIINMEQVGMQIMKGSSQTDEDIPVPEGHYADENMKLTVVPNRNMVMLSMAIAYAVSIGAERVYIGAHSGDHAIYPDCRPEFIDLMNQAGMVANYQSVNVLAPYIGIDKSDICKRGINLGIDYGKAWTCYKGEKEPCGKCGSCVERAEAFLEAGVPDPLIQE